MRDPGRDRSTILIHYYRAMIGRADVWRMRMDATTNWAIGATAAVISFALGDPDTPHYVVFIAVLLTLSFLLLEARRLSFYHLWQQRALLIEEGLIRPALHGDRGEADEAQPDAIDPAGDEAFDLVTALDPHLGRTVPTMSTTKAVARRLRRIYVYLFAVQLLAWLLKLSSTSGATASTRQWASNADVGPIPGTVVLTVVASGFLAAVGLALARGGVDRRGRS